MSGRAGVRPRLPRMALLAIAVAGAVGALSRYGIDAAIGRRADAVFPWGTLTVNVSGCLLAGLLVATLARHEATPEWLRLGLIVGFLGAYTTFSAFAIQIHELTETNELGPALLYGLTSVAAGIAAVYAGFWLSARL